MPKNWGFLSFWGGPWWKTIFTLSWSRGGRDSIKIRPDLVFKTFYNSVKIRSWIFSAPETRLFCFDILEEEGLGENIKYQQFIAVKNALNDLKDGNFKPNIKSAPPRLLNENNTI